MTSDNREIIQIREVATVISSETISYVYYEKDRLPKQFDRKPEF